MPVFQSLEHSKTGGKQKVFREDERAYPITGEEITGVDNRKDERLIILLGMGALLFILFCFRYFPSPAHSSPDHVRVQVQGHKLVLEKSLTDPEIKDRTFAIPASLTPFFYAPVPINSADRKLLETINGIGPRLASEILQTRFQEGPFQGPEDLLRVPGIGIKKMRRFAARFSYAIRKPGNWNGNGEENQLR
jgi:competence ComEA-like helix-hairpin-helix protein